MKIQSVCVYCGSNSGNRPVFAAAAAALGKYLAIHQIRLIYGGASCGTMGILADSCLAAGGEVHGIITEQLHEIVGRHDLSHYTIVPDMATRKRLFLDRSDALIALPGGLGTAEELLEAMCHQTLGLNRKPVALLNIDGFYTPFLAWLEMMRDTNFLRSEQLEQLIVETDLDRLFERLDSFVYKKIKKWDID